jgi:hypothetical protein
MKGPFLVKKEGKGRRNPMEKEIFLYKEKEKKRMDKTERKTTGSSTN